MKDFGEDLGAFVVGPPALDQPRVAIHDPILCDARSLIDPPFSTAVARCGARGQKLDRENRNADVTPPCEADIGRFVDDEEVWLHERLGTEDDVRRALREGRTIRVTGRTIITPSARDAAAGLNVLVE